MKYICKGTVMKGKLLASPAVLVTMCHVKPLPILLLAMSHLLLIFTRWCICSVFIMSILSHFSHTWQTCFYTLQNILSQSMAISVERLIITFWHWFYSASVTHTTVSINHRRWQLWLHPTWRKLTNMYQLRVKQLRVRKFIP